MSERVSEIKKLMMEMAALLERETEDRDSEILYLRKKVADLENELRMMKAGQKMSSSGSAEKSESLRRPQHVSAEPVLKQVPMSVAEDEEEEEFEVMEEEDEPGTLIGESFEAPDSIAGNAQKSEPRWLTDLPGEKVEDVMDAFAFNDRLFFQRELFNGDDDQFELTAERINEARTFREALSDLRSAFPDWDEDSDPVYRFYMAVRRRFVD